MAWRRSGVQVSSGPPILKLNFDLMKKNIKNFYCLDMFPYPSGAGLHVGHPRGYTATDVYARYKRLNGYNVLHPMGWDAFGLPAENFAIKNKVHPEKVVKENVAKFKQQLKNFDLQYDWDKEINTTDPNYYRWTQFIFLKLFERGLAYEDESPINFCPSCKTGLANEEVVGGSCERCGSTIERKKIRQWILKITEYADRLLEDLDGLDWPEPIKEMQRNWIGRSEGSSIIFDIKDIDKSIEVYTTRADTLFGCTWVVLAPEHQLIQNLKDKIDNWDEVEKYIIKSQNKSDLERTELQKEKTGVEIKGITAINPINGEEIPIWISDYVLAHYGTGAVMAVPAHDDRDFQFAKKFNIPIKYVIEPKFVGIDGDGAIKPGLDFMRRNAICAIVRNPKNDNYLCVSWKKFKMHGLITGGIEKDEDPIETAKREIREETGYKNLKFIKSEPLAINTQFYHRVKRENRWAHFQFLHFELENEEKDEIDQKESQLHDILWKSKNELKDFFTVFEGQYIADLLQNGESAFTGHGILVNSAEFDGLESEEAKKKITEKLKACGHGDFSVNYKLRDWVFSRQRYWGEPIPIVHCKKCGIVPVPEKDLPVILPHVEKYEPTGDGTSPLSNEKDPAILKWLNTKCPKCGGQAKRETNTMPQWAGSCWYYIAYLMKDGSKYEWNKEKIDQWLPVDLYVGGAEHAVLHLLYARFWHKILYDEKLVGSKEPFQKLINVGTILGVDGRKMSKSFGNTISPDSLLKKYGSDALKMYELYIGPFSQMAKWDQNGIVGMHRFLQKVEKISYNDKNSDKNNVIINKAIKKVSNDIESFNFNTAISAIIETFNSIHSNSWSKLDVQSFLTLLYPFAPKTTTKISSSLKINIKQWPEINNKYLQAENIIIPVQINGKIREQLVVKNDITEKEIRDLVDSNKKIKQWIPSGNIKKFIFVKNKIVSIVV